MNAGGGDKLDQLLRYSVCKLRPSYAHVYVDISSVIAGISPLSSRVPFLRPSEEVLAPLQEILQFITCNVRPGMSPNVV